MRPVHVLTLSAVVAIALPLASCGGGETTTAQVTTTALPAPSVAAPVKPRTPKKADTVDIPGASSSLKDCLGKNGLYAAVLNDRSTRISTKDGTPIASLLAYNSVDEAGKFASQMGVKDPMQRGKVIAVFLGRAEAKDRKALGICFDKV